MITEFPVQRASNTEFFSNWWRHHANAQWRSGDDGRPECVIIMVVMGSILICTKYFGDHSLMSWWRHQMEKFSVLLDLCVGNSPVTGEFPAQRPVTRSFDVFFDLRHHAHHDVIVMFCCQHTVVHRIYPINRCTCPISHNVSFRREISIFLFWKVHCGSVQGMQEPWVIGSYCKKMAHTYGSVVFLSKFWSIYKSWDFQRKWLIV